MEKLQLLMFSISKFLFNLLDHTPKKNPFQLRFNSFHLMKTQQGITLYIDKGVGYIVITQGVINFTRLHYQA